MALASQAPSPTSPHANRHENHLPFRITATPKEGDKVQCIGHFMFLLKASMTERLACGYARARLLSPAF